MDDATPLLGSIERGEANAEQHLSEAVYAELRKLAAHKMTREAPGHTLQPTALVHEAWLRLLKAGGAGAFENRAHFFGAAAQAMRRILVDRAREKKALKRGGDWERVEIDAVELSSPMHDRMRP